MAEFEEMKKELFEISKAHQQKLTEFSKKYQIELNQEFTTKTVESVVAHQKPAIVGTSIKSTLLP